MSLKVDLSQFSLDDVRSEQAARVANRQAKAVAENADAIKARCSTLIGFVREAWHVLEPTAEYVEGWAIRAIAEHLEAVHFGQIKRLLINVPPGLMKSMMTTIFFPAWEWGPQAKPSTRYLATSYGPDIVTRDTIKFSQLIESEWYQGLWGHRVVRSTPWTQTHVANGATGFRKGSAFENLTGNRANRVLVDDPLSADAADSLLRRRKALKLFRETLPTRLDNRQRDAIIIIMQRLHEDDPSGYIIKHLPHLWTRLILPMEYDPERPCVTQIGNRTWRDPRTQAGELLFPERFPREVVEEDKAQMGPYSTAGQFQQLPSAREGGLFKAIWFERTVDIVPRGSKLVRAWDFAGTEKAKGGDPDATANVLMAKTPDGRYIIASAAQMWIDSADLEATVLEQAQADGGAVGVRIPQDPAQAGKAQARSLTKALAGFKVSAVINSGSKERRATPLASQMSQGNVSLLVTGHDHADAWIQPFVDELIAFPSASHDDQVDAAADAFLELTGVKPGSGFLDYIRGIENQKASAKEADDALRSETQAMKPPNEVGTAYTQDGTRYSMDARGVFMVGGHHVQELERQGWTALN